MSRASVVWAVLVGLALVASSCGGDDGLSADAGEDFRTGVGSSPAFDGCGSSGDIANYAWSIVGTPADMEADIGKPLRTAIDSCTFQLDAAMLPEEVGTWTVELVVTADDGSTASDRVEVEVTDG